MNGLSQPHLFACPTWCTRPAGHDPDPGRLGEVRRIHLSEHLTIGGLDVQVDQFETISADGAILRQAPRATAEPAGTDR